MKQHSTPEFCTEMSDENKTRVKILEGDLTLPLLGLKLEQWNELCENIQIVYHNGAIVRFSDFFQFNNIFFS
jgi:thioester reductase-like protein